MVIEDESQKGTSSGSTVGLNSIVEGNFITGLWSAMDSQQKFKKNYNVQWEHCKIKGHNKENYYQLIGYPANYKGRKKQSANSVHYGVGSSYVGGGAHNIGNGSHGSAIFHGGRSYEQTYAHQASNFGQLHVWDVHVDKGTTENIHVPLTFTPNQYNLILRILNKDKVPEVFASVAGILCCSYKITSGVTNMIG